MGVNLVPIVRNFSIHTENFAAGSHDIDDGCVTQGMHRVMRFDFLTHNKGNADLAVGNPADHPDWYVMSASHGHYHLIDFNEFRLYDANGNPTATGAKQAFCLVDIERIDPGANPNPQFTDCNANQGVSAGWADLYNKALACQYIVIDGLPDGDYTVLSTTNAQHLFPEDTFDDNTICTGLHIAGNTVTEIDPPIGRQLLTSSVNFNDVPEGETTARAVIVEVKTCRSVTIRVQSGPMVNAGSAPGTVLERLGDIAVSVPETNKIVPRQLRLWISYKGTSAGDTGSGQVTISCDETGDTWTVPITANTIARPTVGVVMVLDQSGSMLWDSGLAPVGLPLRNDVLKFAAPHFVEVIQQNNGIGIVAFDHDSFDRMAVKKIGPAGAVDPVRGEAKAKIAAHTPNPNGSTSIGDGVERAHNNLQPVTDYDHKAIIVLTDGHENAAKFLDDVSSAINERVFAIGLGTAETINPVALTKLTNGTGGYLLLTGQIGTDNVFLLSKYYLQILAGVTNQNVVVDPEGYLTPGQKYRVPFVLNEADITSDVILLSMAPPTVFHFAVETPTGEIIDAAAAGALASVEFVTGANVAYYRLTLPVVINGHGSSAGTWNAILSVDDTGYKRYLATLDKDPVTLKEVRTHGVRYSVSVHSLSSLRMNARVIQSSNEPGATMTIRTLLTEYGLPVDHRAIVHVDVEWPDHTHQMLALTEIEPGVFETSTLATLPGVYRMCVRAHGATMRSKPFTREQLLTGAVWKGGDNPAPTSGTDPQIRDEQLCHLLECLLGSKALEEFLTASHIDARLLQECLERFCRERTASVTEAPSREKVEVRRAPAAGSKTPTQKPKRKK
ncbi:lysyl oxidase family protein [Allomesorhizobium camelthorni]|uniref:VWA domain-containing protein n=1 Tax=Allomesorhizobium camelthorni TaxID=475069 RepID=A0A6G4WPU6_9HYPH|nr:lysyl oxidase family protein [Mesorhizobium camelthorni]NGO56077.1 VWA domain-containing protein [Mesorhizobium camelthorni]